ncbi:MAG TPA: anthranilate synthase component I [Hyphomonadaceae bacterium]|nr:anthranilate synthase component I [Hyphomonadaceae bacterium]
MTPTLPLMRLLTRKRVDDLMTPVGAYLRLAAAGRAAFLLESVQGGDWRGRYSIIGLNPDKVWRLADGVAAASDGSLAPDAFTPDGRDALASLRAFLTESEIADFGDAPPSAAGCFGYLSYDCVRLVERLPAQKPDPLGLPDALLLRPRAVAVFDSVAQEIVIAARVPVGDPSAEAEAHAYLDAIEAILNAPAPGLHPSTPTAAPPVPQSNFAKADFLGVIERCKSYIQAGDVFQVVPSQRFSIPFPHPPLALYRALRRLNPSPFLFFFDFGGFAICGSSPEILVRLRDGDVTIRPLAGTRPRGANPAEDAARAADLLADPKERAEHLMLLDLGRNDVGRVAKPGSVKVTERFVVERYSHVMHIVSNVAGEIAEGEDALSAFFAGFPAGTVTGAPKVRAMEIIAEMEPHQRGVYAGAVGYFGADGNMDTCIALRTAIVKDGVMHVQAGLGVVYDSDPETEFDETVHKARALIRAAAEAANFA